MKTVKTASLPELPRRENSLPLKAAGLVLFLFYTFQDFIPGWSWSGRPRILSILFFLGLPVVILILEIGELRRDAPVFFRNFGIYLRWLLPRLAAALILYLLIEIVLNLVIGSGSENQASLMTLPHWFLPLFGILYGPFVEESIYRCFLRRVLSEHPRVFIVLSALFFGAIHVMQPGQLSLRTLYILPYAAMGVFLAAVYVKTDNFCASLFCHMFFNTLFILPILFF